MLKFAQENNFMTSDQHAFMKSRSCLTKVLETLEDLTKALDSDCGIDVIYLDHQNAFHTVPHRRLLKKLKWYGFDGKLLLWIEDFLTDRQMRVSVNDVYFDWAKVTSSVAQGSELGPLLFLLYANDIPASVSCKIKLFADDTKIWNTIKTKSDSQSLQSDHDLLSK